MDPPEQIGELLRRWIEDPLMPKKDTGSLRVNRVLVLLAVTVLLAAGTFLLFSVIQV